MCHFEWSSTDFDRTEKFYSGLFDWEFSPWGDDYLTFKPPEGPGGGIMKVEKVEVGRSPYVYIEVDEIEPYLEKAEELGGGVDTPKTEIPGVGWYAHLLDPDKNIVGLLKWAEKE
jgi:predicted enzyme related to lactoylglutathione lyase